MQAYDEAKVDAMVLALLSLTMFEDYGMTRAWKGHAWEVLDRLYEQDWIHDPRGKAKSVVFTEAGRERAVALFAQYFTMPASDEPT